MSKADSKEVRYKPEERLAQFFLKSVGVECGLYNHGTKQLADGFEAEGLYQAHVATFASAMKQGWAYDDLHDLVASNYKSGVRAALVSNIIPEREPLLKETDNLLADDDDYYHSALYIQRAPQFTLAGSMMLTVSAGSITRKETFTLRDLMTYYYDNTRTSSVSRRREAETKTMVWLLKQASLDEILFAIDVVRSEDASVSVVELTHYLDQGRADLDYRRARSQ